METHRFEPHDADPLPRSDSRGRASDGRGRSPDGRGRSGRRDAPIDVEWLEQQALRYVARWEATQAGVAALLEGRLERRSERGEVVPSTLRDAIPGIVEALVERGYVDDRRFAENALDRMRRQGRSANAIRQRLAQRGVADELVEALLREREAARRDSGRAAREGLREASEGLRDDDLRTLDEELAAAWQTARRSRLGPFRRDAAQRAERRERDLGVLARRGFSHDVAHQVIDAERTIDDVPDQASRRRGAW